MKGCCLCVCGCVIVWRRALQEAQDIFGVDFDFDEFEQFEEDEEEEEEDEEEVSDMSPFFWPFLLYM